LRNKNATAIKCSAYKKGKSLPGYCIKTTGEEALPGDKNMLIC
jgi:hypothetical protein